MGNLSCYNPQPLNQPSVIQQQQQPNPNLLDIIEYTNHLQQQAQNKFFVQFNHKEGIMHYIGVSLENLSQLYNFVKNIKDHDVDLQNLSAQSIHSIQSDIKKQCEVIIDQVKTALFQLNKNTKKHTKALTVNKQKNHHNHIDIPYFLPWITTKNSTVCIYIGEWKYQNRYFLKNFPFGIGRLYLNNQVWQGSIECSLNNFEEKDERKVEVITQQLDDQSLPIKEKILLLKDNFTISLQGMGRKFTKDEESCGNFQNGRLNGKGEYKNHRLQYSYEGTWVDGSKEGNGIQKTKLTNYQGQFSQNKKNGQGTLIFYISTQQQRQRLKQQKLFEQMTEQSVPEYRQHKHQVKTQMTLEEKSDKLIQRVFKDNLNNYKGQELLTLVKPGFDSWEIQGFPFVNKTFIENLKFQLSMKTNFVERYSGTFQNDIFHGKGIYQWSKGNFYVGDWVQGKMEGVGKFYWKEGYSYYGEYKNDLKHGKGEMKWDPYKRHRGNWAFGKKHGYGEEIKISIIEDNLCVVVKAGLWKNDQLKETNIYWKKTFPITESFSQNSLFLSNIEFYYSGLKLNEGMKKKMFDERTKNYHKNPCEMCGSYFLRKEEKNEEENIWRITKKDEDSHKESQPLMCRQCKAKVEIYEEFNSPRKLKASTKA